FILGRLLEQLCARLGARALATNELAVQMNLADMGDEVASSEFQLSTKSKLGRDVSFDPKLETRNPKLFSRTLHLPVPMLDTRVFLKLLQLDLKSHPPQAPVEKVTLAAEPVLPRRSQAGLFVPIEPEPERLELTLARLGGVTGEDRVGAAEVL